MNKYFLLLSDPQLSQKKTLLCTLWKFESLFFCWMNLLPYNNERASQHSDWLYIHQKGKKCFYALRDIFIAIFSFINLWDFRREIFVWVVVVVVFSFMNSFSRIQQSLALGFRVTWLSQSRMNRLFLFFFRQSCWLKTLNNLLNVISFFLLYYFSSRCFTHLRDSIHFSRSPRTHTQTIKKSSERETLQNARNEMKFSKKLDIYAAEVVLYMCLFY